MKNIASLQLPDSSSPDFLAQLQLFGRFLQENCRPEGPHDLKQFDNQLWQLVQAAMLEGLNKFLNAEPAKNEMLMLQWYNSGIIIKTAQQTIAFDLLTIPHFFAWAEPAGLRKMLAASVDSLYVTHGHPDHYDSLLVTELLSFGKKVILPPLPDSEQIVANCILPSHMQHFREKEFSVIAHQGCHVWRNSPMDLPIFYYEVFCPGEFRLLFCGDADYTKGFSQVKPDVDLIFITWRNPGPRFEDGHPEQIATSIDAVNIVINELRPRRIILEHYAELDHVYKGSPASYESAIELIKKLSTPVNIYFWGEMLSLRS
jgi:L-ascorbate metabolism protein UlaG (beta-lactamase superfamily)